MGYNNIIYEKEEGIGIVTLNRPKKLNAISAELCQELEKVALEAEADEKVKILVFTGGDKLFSAGADITNILALESSLDAYNFVSMIQGTFNKIERLGKLVIASVSGIAFGGGCELTLACDFRIASEKASFGLPEIDLGAFPAGGGTQRLPRLVGVTKAKEMLCIGEPISAQEAYRLGLVNKVVPHEKLMEETISMAKKLLTKPALALKKIKSLVNIGISMELLTALEYEAQTFSGLYASHDLQEGLTAFTEKRKANFLGK